jgi:hypothetical protein
MCWHGKVQPWKVLLGAADADGSGNGNSMAAIPELPENSDVEFDQESDGAPLDEAASEADSENSDMPPPLLDYDQESIGPPDVPFDDAASDITGDLAGQVPADSFVK